jgi:tetratricopeptide (TPR) repeat protein
MANVSVPNLSRGRKKRKAMKKIIRRAVMAALVSAASATAVTALMPAQAAVPTPKGKEAAKPAGPSVRSAIGKALNDAMKATDAKDYVTALAKVKEADAVMDKTPFEEYSIAKYLGFIYINQPMPDYPAATAAYNRQIASGGAPEAEQANMYSIAMRLNYQAMDYANVIKNATDLQKFQPLDDTGYLVLIQSYYNTNDFANAAAAAKAELAAKVAANMKPGEDVLGLLLNAQIKNKDEAGARQTLDQLATVSAKPEVWGQVMDFALGTNGITDHQLLNLYRLSILTGTMKDTDFAAMATIDLQSGLPAEAKAVLTKANKTGELLTQANTLAARDQQALPALAAEAAKQTNGEVDVKLGESYYTYGRYDEAVAALQKGIEKGGLKDAADAQTTLGIALLAAGKRPEALAALDKAAAMGGSGGQVAHVWTLYGRRAAA